MLPLGEDRRPWALVLPDGTWLARGFYDDDGWREGTVDFDVLSRLDPDLRVVVIDYHF